MRSFAEHMNQLGTRKLYEFIWQRRPWSRI